MLAIPVGGMIGYALDSKRRESRRENTTCSIKSSVWRTYVLPFIGGILLLFGARMAGIGYALDSKRRESRRENTTCSIKSSVWRTYVLPFIGGILLLFGARMAGGCTSGHMMAVNHVVRIQLVLLNHQYGVRMCYRLLEEFYCYLEHVWQVDVQVVI